MRFWIIFILVKVSVFGGITLGRFSLCFFFFFDFLSLVNHGGRHFYSLFFNNTCFEKHLWPIASENQNLSDEFPKGRSFLDFIILLELLVS